jgi:general secretion pathway protein D
VIQLRKSRRVHGLLGLLVVALLIPGCAARNAYRQGTAEARKGNWDAAVARLTKAVARNPDSVRYRLALDDARSMAARQHADTGRKLLASGELDQAREQFEIAAKFDPINTGIAAALEDARARIRRREEEQREAAERETARVRARAGRYPLPELAPSSRNPIALKFTNEVSLKYVLETLGRVAGVNILFDPDYRDKQVAFNVTGVTFQDALEQLTFVNRLFYKVVDPKTLIVIPQNLAKHKSYDELFLRTFYLRNSDDKEGVTAIGGALTRLIGAGMKSFPDPQLGAITVLGTVDQLALAEKIITSHDKPRGEVLVEVKIIEVNRNRMKQYGIELSNYSAGSTFAPTSGSDYNKGDGLTSVRAHLLSSLNLSDFVLAIPGNIVANFLTTENTSRLLASPRLRAAEGKKASLNIVSEVPVPTTSFYSYSGTTGTDGATSPYAPTTSFQLKSVGLKLDITPTIGSGSEVTLDVKAEFGSEGASRTIGNLEIPTFNTRTIEGQIRVNDGETSLIGGLLQENEQLTLRGILGLQSIPIVGSFFSSPKKTRTETEMLISLTPHIVRAPHVSEADMTPLDSGTQEQVRVKSVQPPLFEEEGKSGPDSAAKPQENPAAPAGGPATAPAPVPPASPSAALPAAPTLGASAAAPGPGAPVNAMLTAARTQLPRGESTTVSLILLRARPFDGVEIDATFDPTAVQLLATVPGGLLTLVGGAAAEPAITFPEPGRLHARLAAQRAAEPPSVSGSGVVAVFTVRVLKEGATSFRIESLRTFGGPSAAGESIPPPPALALTVSAAGNAPGGPS